MVTQITTMPEDVEIKSTATVQDGSLHQTIGQNDGFEIKSNAEGQSYIKGYIATKDSYSVNGERYHEEAMSEEALRSIADQINNANKELASADVAFPDPSVMEKTKGNIEHQDTEKMEKLIPGLADTRTVPAIELASAEYDGYGVEVKAPIREDALPEDTVDAIKENIKDGVLSAFSIEFRNAKDKLKRVGGKIKRVINSVDVAGAGLTAAPKNPTATLTGAEIRSVIADNHDPVDSLKQELKAEIVEELKAEYMFETGDWVSRDWQGGEVYGKIRDRTKDSFTVDGNEISGEEEEPVYKMEEYDTEQEEFTGQMIAAPQSSLTSWSGAPENKSKHTEEMKSTSKASVKFRGTKEGKMDESRIDKEEHNLSDHYLFGEGEDKEDFSYPVVDADGYLRRGNVEAAHSLGARGGVDASELERKLEALNNEFDSPPIDFKEEQKNNLNDTMPDDPEQGDRQSEGEPEEVEAKSETSEEVEEEDQTEVKSELRETVTELKSSVDELKSQNEELRDKNEELRSELEDMEELEELKSEVDDIEEELKSITSEDQPVSDPKEQKHEQKSKTPGELKAASPNYLQENKSVLADKYNMTEEEVLDHAEE